MDLQDIPPIPFGTNEEAWYESYQRIMRVCQSFPNANPAKLRDAFLKIRNGEVDFDQVLLPTGNRRILSVPLQKLSSGKNMHIQWLLAQTQQINLKTFYPFIAYMFDSVRRLAPTQERNNAKHPDPFIEGMFEKLGRRINPTRAPTCILRSGIKFYELQYLGPAEPRPRRTIFITLSFLARNMISKFQIYPAWRNYRRGGKGTNHWKVYKCSYM